MKFCFACGQQLVPEARFCVSCGTAAAEPRRQPEYAAAGRSAGPGSAPAQDPIPQESAHEEPDPQEPAPRQPASAAAVPVKSPGAFAGIPLSDYIRDGVAALALLMSLFMAWSYGSDGTSKAAARVDVVLITLVSLLSLGLSYAWRAGIFGPATGYRRIQDLKLLANAPYVLMVLVYTALSLISADRFDPGAVAALGPAVAFGLAGALLAAQPRRAEIAPGAVDEPRNRRWIHITLGVAGLAAVTALAQVVRYWAAYGGQGSTGWGTVATLMALASPAILVFIALRVNRRSDPWRRAGVALALGSGFLSLLALIEDLTLLQLSVTAFVPGFSLLFWMAFGAAVSAPSVARLTEASAVPATDTRSTLQPLLVLAAGLSALLVLGSAITLVTVAADGASDGLVPQGIALFFGLLLTAGAVLTLRFMGKDPRSAYILPSGYAGLLAVLGLVLMIVWVVQDEDAYLGPVIMLLTFVVPAALLASLWQPAASREQFRELPAAQGNGATGFSFAGVPAANDARDDGSAPPARVPEAQPAADAGPAQTAQAPAVDISEVLEEAANPATPLARLQEIAASHPTARPAVAANPSTYPALLAWLGALGDPAVDQALRQRS